jgi:uncharacterized protein CbrC (UPF0167 family)
MLQPSSELPWIGEDFDDLKSNDSTTYICDSGHNNIFCEAEDFQYLKQACNNFPKAIKLLKEFIFEWENSGSPKYDLDKLSDKVQEFLKSLEKDGE